MASQSANGIAYEISGSGDPVVMIHGLGGDSRTFEPLLPALSHYKVVRLDLPGSGKSAPPVTTLSVEFFSSEVVSLLRTLEFGAAHFVGHSLGTLVCQHLAIRERRLVRSLTLFGALTEPADAARAALQERASMARRNGMASIANEIATRSLAPGSGSAETTAASFVRDSLMRQSAEGYARTCEALSRARAMNWTEITVPTLLVTGTVDPVAPPAMAARLNDNISGSKLVLLPDCGHWPTIEKATDCSRELSEFMNDGLPPALPTSAEEKTMTNELGDQGSTNVSPSDIIFKNVRILDATGDQPYLGEVWVQGNRIREIKRTQSSYGSANGSMPSASNGATVVDGGGATLMPGMIDAHLHLSWNNAPGIDPIQMMEVEEHMLVTMEMAKLVLDSGFTSGRGAASAKPRLDVVCKKFINEGRFPGPRYKAAGPEITTVGGLGDAAPSHIPHEGLNLGWVVSGPEEVRRAVRILIKYGVDSIKLNLSGESITGMAAEETPMAEDEIAMAVQEARCRNKVLSAHARSSGSVKQCVRFGIENIYHASFADEEALTMLERAKDKHFVAPGIAWLINTARHAEEYGIKPGSPIAMEYERELDMCVETMKKMHARGIRVCIGGDYGFAWTPQGTNAKDIQTFVEMLGFTPMAAIQAATKYGGEIMGMGNELGMIKEGYLADMLLVDGDPLADVKILQDANRLLAIMKDGSFYKAPTANRQMGSEVQPQRFG